MSDTVDTRVVEMQFDNKQFEKGVRTSITSLEELRKELKLDNITSSLEQITNRFSTMGIVGMTAIQDITRSAIRGGKQMIDSLYIDPAKTGFNEYETQMNAVQTILANTSKDGVGIEKVNQKLDELNAYADKTIYNFSEMTRNIGTFTAAGVDIDTSTNAIKGIANLAAVSGSTSQQASTAMYQLSQAIAAGSVKLQDWNSVVNAGMGGEVFQDALMRTGKLMRSKLPKDAKEMFDALQKGEVSFRESLSSGWITDDILTHTLATFTGDMTEDQLLKFGYSNAEVEEILKMGQTAQDAATKVKTLTQLFDTLKEAMGSGWAQSWELIVGDFEEAKELFTSISDYFSASISKAAESRNRMLENWKYMGGRQALIDSFWNMAEAIDNVKEAIGGVFKEFFPPMNALQLTNMTFSLEHFTEKVKALTEDTEVMGKVTGVVRKFAQGLAFGRDMIIKGISGFSDLGEKFKGFGEGLGAAFEHVKPFESASASLTTIFEALHSSAIKIKEAFIGLFPKDESDGAKTFAEKISDADDKTGKWTERLTKLKMWMTEFSNSFTKNVSAFTEYSVAMLDSIKKSDKLKKAGEKVSKTFASVKSKVESFVTTMKAAFAAFFATDTGESEEGSLLDRVKQRFDNAGTVLSGWHESFKAGATESLEKLKGFFSDLFGSSIPNLFKTVSTWASQIMHFAGIDSIGQLFGTIGKAIWGFRLAMLVDNIVGITGNMKKLGTTLKKTLKSLGDGIKDIAKDGITFTKENKDSLGTTMLKMAASIAILVGSMYAIANMKTADIAKSLGVIGVLAIELSAFAGAFKLIGGDGAKAFKDMGIAILAMTVPIWLLGSMDTEKALKGIIGVGLIMAEMAAFMKLSGGKGFAGETKFVSMAAALGIMVLAIKGLGDMDTGDLTKGVIGMMAMMTTMASFMKKSTGFGKASGLIGVAAALGVMTMVMKQIGEMKFSTLVKGTAALAGMMVMLKTLGSGLDVGSFGKSILMLATTAGALFIFLEAFKRVKDLDSDSIVAFSGSLSAVLLAISGAMGILGNLPISGVFMGIANLALAIAGVGGVIVALGALNEQWDGAKEMLNSGGEMLQGIGEAIGNFFGGIGVGLSESFADIGTNLSSFMTNATPFLDGLKKIDSTTMDGAASLAGALLAITATEVVTGLVNFFSGGDVMSSFSTNIGTLGTALNTFATNISGFSEVKQGDIDNAIALANALVDINNALPAEGGLAQIVAGCPDLSTFTESIPGFASGLKAFSTNISGFTDTDQKDIDKSISLAKALVELNNALPDEGGMLQKITGIPDLTGFSEKIPGFATALKDFASNISGFGETKKESIDNALATAKALVDLTTALPETGGWLQKITGVPDLSGFGENIKSLATALSDYATNISGISAVDQASMDNSLSILGFMSDFANEIPAQDGWLQKIMGMKDLGTFSDNITSLGSALKSFADNVVNVNVTNTEGAISALDLIQDFADKLDIETTFFEWITGKDSVSKFTDQMLALSGGLNQFATQAATIDTASAESVIKVMQDIVNLANSAKDVTWSDTYAFTGFFDVFRYYDFEELETTANTLVDGFIVPFQNGLRTGTVTAVNSAMNMGVSMIRSYYNSFYNAGHYLASGIANGMRGGASLVSVAASSVGSIMLGATRTTLDEHSPSREGYDIGKNYDLGIANGVTAFANKVSQSAAYVGTSAIESSKMMLGKVMDVALSDMNMTPTIRPVMDMTDLNSGVAAINTMFGGNMFMGSTFRRHATAISSGNSGSNKDVVNAIQALNSKFDHLNQAMNNMKIVLDDGTLVGHMASGMDKQLGVLAGRRERGN